MGKIIRLTESELVSLIKQVIREEKYSEEDLKYTHPKTGESCKVKVAEFKPATEMGEQKFHGVLVCPKYGEETIVATLPVIKPTFSGVKNFICKHIDRTFEILDDMLGYSEEEIFESVENERFRVIDSPINCDVDYLD